MKFATVPTLILTAVLTSGCATSLFKDDCDWAKPIKPSRQDVLTRGTKEQIVTHNETGQKVCGRKWARK